MKSSELYSGTQIGGGGGYYGQRMYFSSFISRTRNVNHAILSFLINQIFRLQNILKKDIQATVK